MRNQGKPNAAALLLLTVAALVVAVAAMALLHPSRQSREQPTRRRLAETKYDVGLNEQERSSTIEASIDSGKPSDSPVATGETSVEIIEKSDETKEALIEATELSTERVTATQETLTETAESTGERMSTHEALTNTAELDANVQTPHDETGQGSVGLVDSGELSTVSADSVSTDVAALKEEQIISDETPVLNRALVRVRPPLVHFDPKTIIRKPQLRRQVWIEEQVFNLPQSANEWCYPPSLPQLPYEECDTKGMINALPLFGGLTNALKMILLGVIHSFEQNRCFYIDQTGSELAKHHILEQYFEPIGLSPNSNAVQAAIQEGRVQKWGWQELWENHRQNHGTVLDVPALGYYNIEGHGLKRNMLKRMWRPLPKVRRHTCENLENFGLSSDFMAFSVRRGDKTEENMTFATTQQYIDRAEIVIDEHFGGVPPIIFVATDTCEVMEELRQAKPAWTFVGECDYAEKHEAGFALRDVPNWTAKEADDHYMKFFTELVAMASAKVFIGVWYTNISWWAFFMRQNGDVSTFILLDTAGKPSTLPFSW